MCTGLSDIDTPKWSRRTLSTECQQPCQKPSNCLSCGREAGVGRHRRTARPVHSANREMGNEMAPDRKGQRSPFGQAHEDLAQIREGLAG